MADEFVGGKLKNKHQQGRERPKYGKGIKGQDNKTAVLSLVNTQTGEVRSRVIPDVTGATLRKAIAEQVVPHDTTLYTDSAGGYRGIGDQVVRHESVDHSAHEYVRGDVTTNHAEGYFSQMRRLMGQASA